MLSRPIPQAKPEKRRTTKGRKRRAERTVKQSIRSRCADRDGYCRIGGRDGTQEVDIHKSTMAWCQGVSEWAHLRGYRRSQTRGQAPERRHTTMHSLMLCSRHHGMEER